MLAGSDFPKQGRKSAGVARQYCGRLGKVANCQAGMFLAYVSPLGRALVDKRLYLPESWDLQILGDRWVALGHRRRERPGDLVPRAAGPFNYPTELVPSPSGDLYVSDGYRNARVHRLLRGWPAHFVLVRAGQGGAEPVPPAPQRTGGRGRHGVRLRPGE